MEEGLNNKNVFLLHFSFILFSRSLGRYSSEEESDTDVKVSKKKDNRRATMAAPVMQPPSSNVKIRKSIRLNDTPETEVSLLIVNYLVLIKFV